VQDAIVRFRVRSASRRGFVIIVGDWLVRLTDDTGTWVAHNLPPPVGIARELLHEHMLTPVQLSDGWDVLECAACGMEW
jgi:hypothetical protein